MFLVRDRIEARHEKIRTFMGSDDAAIAVLLAAADFERTVRRAILALGNTPTKQLRTKVLGASGLRRLCAV